MGPTPTLTGQLGVDGTDDKEEKRIGSIDIDIDYVINTYTTKGLLSLRGLGFSAQQEFVASQQRAIITAAAACC